MTKLNVPNTLTMIRIFCTPLVVLMFLLPIPNGVGVYVALGLYVFGCFTDLLDGHIARKYNLITDFGKFMDQIADKFITTTAMILVLFAGITYHWLAVVMLLVVVLRDILISGIRMVAANKNFVIPADIYGKVKSFFLDVGNMVLMFYVGLRTTLPDAKVTEVFRLLGLAILIVGVVLSIISCVNYSVKSVKALNEKQAKEDEEKRKAEIEKAKAEDKAEREKHAAEKAKTEKKTEDKKDK